MHLDTVKVYYSPTNAQVTVLKNNIKIYMKIALIFNIYIFTSYTTINIKIHTIKCYKFYGYMFRSLLRPSSVVFLQCAYNMGSHNMYIIFFLHELKTLLKVFTIR